MSSRQIIIKGAHTLDEVPKLLSKSRPKARKILLLTYGGGANMSAVAKLERSLRVEIASLFTMAFSTKLLSVDDLARVRKTLLEAGMEHPDALVSIGGGSVLDLAKLIKLGLGPSHALFHVAIPTTAGTGSEATPFAVVYQGTKKQTVEEAWLRPEAAILDPTLLDAMPRALMLAPFLDALSQSIESIWSLKATEESRLFARHSIEKLLQGSARLRRQAMPSPSELELLLEGAHLSGRAIAISRTTLAHALSYALTSKFNVPHGLAVFLNLSRLLRFNAETTESDCLDPAGPEGVHNRIRLIAKALGVSDAENRSFTAVTDEAALTLTALGEELGLDVRISSYGIRTEDDAAWLIDSSLDSPRAGNNPRRVERKELLNYFVNFNK